MINRLITKELLEILTYFPVLGVVGSRQVGKTTIAKYISTQIEKDSVYIDLENPADRSKLTDPILFFERHEEKCIILDEIQREPDLFPVLRSMIDKNRSPGRFLILGSASPHLIKDSSESLAGRIAYEELTPFNILEVDEKQTQDYHWISGGYPGSFLLPSSKLRSKWLTNFIKTYIERDLPMLGLNIDRDVIRKLWTMLAHLHGNILNVSTVSNSLGLTSTTVKKYISFLEEAFLIRQLKPYFMNIKKRLVKSPKVYIRDSGIFHHLLGIENLDSLAGNPVIGNSWEGYVIEQICQQLPQGYEPYFYRTHQGAECDLVIVKLGIPYFGIEIKYTSSPQLSKGFKQSIEDIKTIKNFIITPKSDDYLISKDIRVCNLKEFLQLYLQ